MKKTQQERERTGVDKGTNYRIQPAWTNLCQTTRKEIFYDGHDDFEVQVESWRLT